MKVWQKFFDDAPRQLIEHGEVIFTGPMSKCKDTVKRLMAEENSERHFSIANLDGKLLAQCKAKPRRTPLWTAVPEGNEARVGHRTT